MTACEPHQRILAIQLAVEPCLASGIAAERSFCGRKILVSAAVEKFIHFGIRQDDGTLRQWVRTLALRFLQKQGVPLATWLEDALPLHGQAYFASITSRFG